MAKIFISIAGKLAEYAVDPIIRQFKYLICYDSNIKNLKDEMDKLENKKFGVQRQVDEAERNAQDIGPDVLSWNQKVDDLKKESDEVLKGTVNSNLQCLFFRCPNLKTRYILGRKATKKTAQVVKLQGECEFQRVGHPRPPVQVPNQPPHIVDGFKTRISIQKEIVNALLNDKDNIIGICGMPGVGKTTMVNEIVIQVNAEKLFDEVATAVVSQEKDFINIQDQLAEMLGLKIEEKTNSTVRAGRLRERLGGGNKRILVLLDDVWNEIDLETLGIPSRGDCKGLKIILTSRFEDVCSTMGARIFKVDVLSEEEAWELFKEEAGISHDATDVKDIAQKVAVECRGLPLALVIVGSSLRNRAKHVWKDAHRQLKKARVTNLKGMHNFVYKSISLSFNYLESDELKCLLLLCSLFQEDESIPIERLVCYAKGLEVFKNTDTLSETRDGVKSVVDYLRSCYLLLSGKKEEEVKLHDVVRDFCLQVASRDGYVNMVQRAGLKEWQKDDAPVYMVKHADLKEWPKQDTEESFTAISMTFDELDHLPSGQKYVNLKLLRVLFRSWGSQNISNDFFEKMRELRVLQFNNMRTQIPLSLQFLTGLQTLCLVNCSLNLEISMIGSLKKLEILSFYDSVLSSFPNEIAGLGNLRSLDLRFNKKSSPTVPPGILSGLTKLEELYLGCFPTRDEVQNQGFVKEIRLLTGLDTFQICTNDPLFLLQILEALNVEKLERFDISRYANLRYFQNYDFKKSLVLLDGVDASMLTKLAINSLIRKSEVLSLEVMNWKSPLSELDGEGFVNLKELKIQCGDFEYLIDASDINQDRGAFNQLQELSLEGLSAMKMLCRGGVISGPSLGNLTVIYMEHCEAIASLFTVSIAKCLANLQKLTVESCEKLEVVVSTETDEVTEIIEFPKLKETTLSKLPTFKTFTSASSIVGVLRPLFNQVILPNMEELNVKELNNVVELWGWEIPNRYLCKPRHLTRLVVERCGKLRYLFSPSMAKLLERLEHISIKSCEAMEEIIGSEENEMVEVRMTSKIVFPKLKKLQLQNLKSCKMFCSEKYELVFLSLVELAIKNCPVMRKMSSGQYVGICNFLDAEGLEKLRSLDLGFVPARDEDQHFHQEFVKEISLLSGLKEFMISTNDSLFLLQILEALNVEKVERFTVIRAAEDRNVENSYYYYYYPRYRAKRTLYLLDGVDASMLTKPAINSLIRTIDNLSLEVMNWKSPLSELDGDGFINLMKLKISSGDFEYLIDASHLNQDMPFAPSLRELELFGLSTMKMLCKGIIKAPSLGNLTELDINNCIAITSLYTVSVAKCLVNLQTLKINDCKKLEEVVSTENDEVTEIIEFPKLKKITLSKLPSFKTFSSESSIVGVLQPLFNQVLLPHMEELEVEELNNIVKLWGRGSA